jgi:uncharacterized protein
VKDRKEDTDVSARRRVVIAGGTGFLGRSLAAFLARRDWEVVVLGRRPRAVDSRWRQLTWDARTVGPWARELDRADALVNLAGRSVDCVKTPERCDEILRSRVESTRVLGRALERVATPPRVWVQMSTAHIYGDPPDIICDEDAAFGYGLAPSVGRAWEEALTRAAPTGIRQVILRTSFVLRAAGRCAAAARDARPPGVGRPPRSWTPGHQLDSRTRHESPVRARAGR